MDNPHIGLRLEAVQPSPRTTGKVVSIQPSGMFTVKYEEGSFYKTYDAEDFATMFRTLPGTDVLGEAESGAYSSCPDGDKSH